jgi:DnaJ-class molecular chaperone
MSNKRCHYEVLQINKTATEDEIKTSYNKLARLYHPDKNLDNIKEAEEKFNSLNFSYNVLLEKDTRLNYDIFLFQELHQINIFQNLEEINNRNMFMVFNSPNVFQNLEEINNRNMFIVFNSPNINPNNLNIYL